MRLCFWRSKGSFPTMPCTSSPSSVASSSLQATSGNEEAGLSFLTPVSNTMETHTHAGLGVAGKTNTGSCKISVYVNLWLSRCFTKSAVHVVQAEPLESYILAQTPRSRTKSQEHVDLCPRNTTESRSRKFQFSLVQFFQPQYFLWKCVTHSINAEPKTKTNITDDAFRGNLSPTTSELIFLWEKRKQRLNCYERMLTSVFKSRAAQYL